MNKKTLHLITVLGTILAISMFTTGIYIELSYITDGLDKEDTLGFLKWYYLDNGNQATANMIHGAKQIPYNVPNYGLISKHEFDNKYREFAPDYTKLMKELNRDVAHRLYNETKHTLT